VVDTRHHHVDAVPLLGRQRGEARAEIARPHGRAGALDAGGAGAGENEGPPRDPVPAIAARDALCPGEVIEVVDRGLVAPDTGEAAVARLRIELLRLAEV